MANQARIRTLFVKRAYHLYPQLMTRFNELNLIGPGDGSRTRTVFPPRDFKSLASAYSATPGYIKKSFFLSLTYINIITYFLKNVKFFFYRRQDFFLFCPLGLTTSLSPRVWWGERGFEPAQHLSDGFTVHILLLKSFSFTLHIYYIIFFIKNQTDLLIAAQLFV